MIELYRISKEKFLDLPVQHRRVLVDSGNLIVFGIRDNATEIGYDKETKEYVFRKEG